MSTVRSKIANSLRNAWGATVLYGTCIATPIVFSVATLDTVKDDFNDVTNAQSDEVVEKYEQRYKSMSQLSERIDAMSQSANQSKTPEQSAAFKTAEFELESELATKWETYTNDVLEDVVLTEAGYKKIEEMATIAGQSDSLPATIHSWDECRADSSTASEQVACMDERQLEGGAEFLLILGLSTLMSCGITFSVMGSVHNAHRKLADRIDKKAKHKRPSN